MIVIISNYQNLNALEAKDLQSKARAMDILTIRVSDDTHASSKLMEFLDAADRFDIEYPRPKDGGGTDEVGILVNIAPPRGRVEQIGRLSGAQFASFVVGDVVVISSLHGETLSFVRKLGIVESICLLDIPTVMDWAVGRGLITRKITDGILNSYWGFEFFLLASSWMWEGRILPYQVVKISDFVPMPLTAVWAVSNSGNYKTTLLPDDLKETRARLVHPLSTLPLYDRPSDVPDGTMAWVVGTSGFGERRFLEIMVQGGSAADSLKLSRFSSDDK